MTRRRSPPAAVPPGSLALQTLVALRRGRDMLDRDYAQPLAMSAVAGAAGYSLYHFVRIFGAAYGQSPGAYLRRRRIERAQQLLRSGRYGVTETCYAVGFASLGSFSAGFHRQVGLSPSAYRALWCSRAPLPVPGCFLLMGAAPLGGADAATGEKPGAAPAG